jgi:5,10-methenyltetrahydromethanopterin hydrogenase
MAAVGIITASMRDTVEDVADRTPEQIQAYADAITGILGDQTDFERLLTIAYLGDIARLLNETLAKERGVTPEQQIQDIALRIAESTIEP